MSWGSLGWDGKYPGPADVQGTCSGLWWEVRNLMRREGLGLLDTCPHLSRFQWSLHRLLPAPWLLQPFYLFNPSSTLQQDHFKKANRKRANPIILLLLKPLQKTFKLLLLGLQLQWQNFPNHRRKTRVRVLVGAIGNLRFKLGWRQKADDALVPYMRLLTSLQASASSFPATLLKLPHDTPSLTQGSASQPPAVQHAGVPCHDQAPPTHPPRDCSKLSDPLALPASKPITPGTPKRLANTAQWHVP